jgi:hypothetical protein
MKPDYMSGRRAPQALGGGGGGGCSAPPPHCFGNDPQRLGASRRGRGSHREPRQGSVGWLLQLEQLSKQNGFVTAGARAGQPQGMAKESARWATPLTEAALATLATLVQGMGDERSAALKVAAELSDVDARERPMAEAKCTLFARRFAVDGAGARWRATADWAATQGSGGG